MVRFRKYIYVSDITEKRDYNFVDRRREKEMKNRRLSEIETYMKKNNLLFGEEFLEFSKIKTQHIRLPYIECICRGKKWIYDDEYLKIVL